MEPDSTDSRKWRDRAAELDRWINDLLEMRTLTEAIEAVEQRRRGADIDDNYLLALELKDLLIDAGREPEAERLFDEMIALLPDDIRFPIGKACFYLYVTDKPESALEAINFAIARAHRTGFFRREALGVKARILLKLRLGEQLSRTLEEIMSLEMRCGIPDSRRERDFVDRAPRGMIPEDVLTRYSEFCPHRDDK
jgi:tetratricopeptide (TPR) repeat protein